MLEKDGENPRECEKIPKKCGVPSSAVGFGKESKQCHKIPPLASASICTTWITWTRAPICAHAGKLPASIKLKAPVFVLPAETEPVQHSAWCLFWIWCRGRTTQSFCDLLGRPGLEMSNLAQSSLFSLLTSLHKVFAHVFNGFQWFSMVFTGFQWFSMVFTLFLFSLVTTQQSGRGLQAWRESHCLRQKGMLHLKGKHETSWNMVLFSYLFLSAV